MALPSIYISNTDMECPLIVRFQADSFQKKLLQTYISISITRVVNIVIATHVYFESEKVFSMHVASLSITPEHVPMNEVVLLIFCVLRSWKDTPEKKSIHNTTALVFRIFYRRNVPKESSSL